jgi:hypothetical protein
MSRPTPFEGLFCCWIENLFLFLGVASSEGDSEGSMKVIQCKARDIKSGDTVLDRSTRFIIKEVRAGAEQGLIAFIDMEGVWHGVYHPDEYLAVGDDPLAELSVTDFPEALQAAFEWVMSSKLTGRDLQISSPPH